MADKSKKQKANSGFDFLAEDLDNTIENCNDQAYQYNKDAQDVLYAANSGGVIEGLLLTGLANTVSIAAGVAQNMNGVRAAVVSGTLDVTANVGDVGYIVLNIVTEDDSTTNRTHPFSGVVRSMETKITTTYSFELDISGDVDTYVSLGRIGSWNDNIPIFDDIAALTFPGSAMNGITFNPKISTSVDQRGDAGNNYHVRIENIVGAILNISEKEIVGVQNNYYLDIIVPADSAGVATVSYADLNTALTSAGLSYFSHTLEGASSASLLATWALPEQYHSLTDGNSYRRYWFAKTDTEDLDDHTSRIGHGVSSDSNPHGVALADISGYDTDSLPAHKRRDHLFEKSGIAKHSDIGFLGTSISGATVTIAGIPASNNNASINGYSVVEINNPSGGGNYTYIHATPANSRFALHEFRMSQQGNVYYEEIIDVQLSLLHPVTPIRTSGGFPVLSFISKSPELAGDIEVECVVSGAGSVYTVRIQEPAGATWGTAVDCSSGITRVYNPDGHYIEFNKEINVLTDATYGNIAKCVSSQDGDQYLSISEIFWRGDDNYWGYAATRELINTRKYGTDSVENNYYDDSGNSLGYGISFENGASVFTSAGGMQPFSVSYRGTEYSVPAMSPADLATLLGTTNGDKFIVARFNDVRDLTITNIGTTLSAWNRSTDVLIAYVEWDALAIVSVISYENLVKNEVVSNTIDIGMGGWTMLHAIRYATILYKTFPQVSLTFNLISDNTFGHPRPPFNPLPNLFIQGNGYKIKVTPAFFCTSLAVNTNKVVAHDCLFEDFAFTGIAGASAQDFRFENCEWVSVNTTYAVKTTSGVAKAFFKNCGFSISTIVDADATTTTSYFNNCTNTSGLIIDASGISICTIEGSSVLGSGRFVMNGASSELYIRNNRSWSIGASGGIEINASTVDVASIVEVKDNKSILITSNAQTEIVKIEDSGVNTTSVNIDIIKNNIYSSLTLAADSDLVNFATDSTYVGNINIFDNTWLGTASVAASALVFVRTGSTATLVKLNHISDVAFTGTLNIEGNKLSTNNIGGAYIEFFIVAAAGAANWFNHCQIPRLYCNNNILSGSATKSYLMTNDSTRNIVKGNQFIDSTSTTVRKIYALDLQTEIEVSGNNGASSIIAKSKATKTPKITIHDNVGKAESGLDYIYFYSASTTASYGVIANVRDNYADMSASTAAYAVNGETAITTESDVSVVTVIGNTSVDGAGTAGTQNDNVSLSADFNLTVEYTNYEAS